MDVGTISITQAEAEGSTDQNTAGGDIRGGEKRKSECGEEPPSTRLRLQALVDALHSVSEVDEGVSTTSSIPQVAFLTMGGSKKDATHHRRKSESLTSST